MRHEQRLYPDVVYRFNDIFQTVWQNHLMGSTSNNIKNDDVLVTPVFFSKGSRTFHWIGLDSHMWNWEEKLCREYLTQFIKGIKTFKSSVKGLAAWELFCKNQPSMDVYKEAIKTIDEAVRGNNTNQGQMHRAILLLYSGFHHDAQKNIEGILYNFLTTCTNHGDINRSDYLKGELPGEPPFKKFKPKDICSALTGGDCKERSCLIKQCSEIPITNEDLPQDLLDIFLMFVEHLLWHKSGGNHTFGNRITNKNQVVLLPLYDVWIGNCGYGGIKAVFIVFFDKDNGEATPRQAWLENKFPKLRDAFQELAEEVTASAETLAASAPISPPYDLVRHFLKVLVYVQDWQSAAIFNNDGTFLYEYKRTQKDSQGTWAWEEGGKTDNEQALGEADNQIQERGGKPDNSKRYYMWWTAGKKSTINLWSKEFLPDISDEEVSRFCNISIRFEFPEATHIPLSDGDRSLLYQEYLRQQLDLMRMLIPKVRARRAALRSAVSAIMGRNMSHNIGSHVLARYSSAIKHDLDLANKEKTDHRTDFLSYLQRRMDFLAEVATSDSAHWAQPLSLRDAVSKLNYQTQKDRIEAEQCKVDSGASCTLKQNPDAKKNEPILLSYITGKESLKASVEFGVPEWNPGNASGQKAGYIVGGKAQSDYWFSCPGGEVGVQALYVILENIIRNSARHASGDSRDEFVKVFVSVEEFKTNKNGDEELIKLTIIDPRTKLDPPVNGEAQTELCDLDAEGNRIKKESLTAEINSILQCEPFLNADGSTNPHYWGVREMQICAHYLRGYPLSDLECMKYDPAVIAAKAYPDPAVSSDSELPVPGYCLSYEIYAQRAKLLAVVNFSGKADYEKNGLEQKGIKFIEVSGLCAKEEPTSPSGESHSYNPWRELGNKVHGFSFVALPPNCKPGQRNELPVRTSPLEVDELKKALEDACSEKGLKWMEPLHERVAKSYREKSYPENGNAKNVRWGNDNIKIHAVVGWKDGDIGTGVMHHVNLEKLLKGELPRELLVPGKSPIYLGLAWFDHPNDKDLLKEHGAIPVAAAIRLSVGNPNWACVEPMFSDSPHTQLLKKLRQEPSAPGAAELVSAALARVVVLDERIQSRRMDMVRSVSLRVYWPLAGIWCPFHPNDVKEEDGVATDGGCIIEADMYHSSDACCDLDRPDFEAIQRFLTKPSKLDHQLPADFLVIHLTILENLNKKHNEEKAQGEEKENLNQTLSKLVEGTACKDAEIVIVTGRGVPTAARHHAGQEQVDARFLPISALLEYLVTRPSKLALMRALWSAAAPRHDSDDISGG